MKNKRFLAILIVIASLLLIPFIAMQFTDEVNWDARDFVTAGALLLFTGIIIELLLVKVKKKNTRIALVLTVLIVLILIWIELAVGIFGSPLAGS